MQTSGERDVNGPASPTRVGLIGYGYAGKTFHAPLIAAVPTLRLRAVASSAADKALADLPDVAIHADPYALIGDADIDLVVIATPNATHAPLARAAIAAGKHVVVEKPFALTLAEGEGIVALAEQHGVLLSVFHNRRWDSDFLTVSQAVRDGLVGTVSHFESHLDRFRPLVQDRWRERAGAGSGVWFDLGPHLVDQALQLFGLPDGVQASFAAQRPGAVTVDWAHVILCYGERRIVLHAGMLVAGGSHRFVVHGDGGTLVKQGADRQEQQLTSGMLPGDPGWGEDPDCLVVHAAAGPVRQRPSIAGDQRRFYEGIAAALGQGAPNPVPAREALSVMAVVEAAARSAAASGTTVAHCPPGSAGRAL